MPSDGRLIGGIIRGLMSNDSKFDALLEKEEDLLKKAVGQTMKAYNGKSTVANLRDWEAAKAALDGYRVKASKQAAAVVSFATKREVIAYLIEAGWDVKPDSSKVNDDLNGLPKKQGVWPKKVVDEYAGMALRKADGINGDVSDETKKRLRAERELAEQKTIKAKRENEIEAGRWVRSSDVRAEFAKRMMFLRADQERFVYEFIPRIIEMTGGDDEKRAEAIDEGLRLKDEWMDRYSKPMEFHASGVLVTEDEEG